MNFKKFKFFRGAHVQKMLDEASSISNLHDYTIRGFPNTTKRQHATDPVQIVQMKLVPYVQTHNLLVNAVANSGGKKYDPTILFLTAEFENEDTPTNVTFTGSDNKEYNVQPISLRNVNVKVHCNCLDFHYRFATWNANDDSLQGTPPPPYQRKTETRPPANPDHVPGLCKHLIKTVDALRDAGLVVG